MKNEQNNSVNSKDLDDLDVFNNKDEAKIKKAFELFDKVQYGPNIIAAQMEGELRKRCNEHNNIYVKYMGNNDIKSENISKNFVFILGDNVNKEDFKKHVNDIVREAKKYMSINYIVSFMDGQVNNIKGE
jgi:tRNA pseudouridine-54 N-methylase